MKQNAKKSTRKSVLSALYVLTKLPQFQEQMMKDAKDIHEEYKEQIDKRTFEIVRAGLHWSFKISKQIPPLLLIFG